MTTARRRLDDNLYLLGDSVHCVRCDALVGTSELWLQHAIVREKPAQSGGSLVRAAPELFVDAPIVFRQASCPGCLTALLTEVTAQADRHARTKRLTAQD